jgi:hypothetical protein
MDARMQKLAYYRIEQTAEKDRLESSFLPHIVLTYPRLAKAGEMQGLQKSKHKRLSKHLQNFEGRKSPKGLGIELEK